MAVPEGTLKRLVDVGKNPTRVIGSVERFMLAKPSDDSRATDVIHPSAMIKPDWCHRAEYYHLQGHVPAPPKRKASLKQLMVFEEGHRIHDRWQNWFWSMGKLYGLFECNYCDTKFYDVSARACPSCNRGRKFLKYREVPVVSEAHGIRGHADGWLRGFGEDLLLEVKSVGEGTFAWEDRVGWQNSGEDFKKSWSSLRDPFTTHTMQAQVYMKLLEIMNPKVHPKEAVFIYESKPTQEIKEFVIPKSDFSIAPLFDAAAMIMDAISKQVPPSCNVGANSCSKCEGFNGN
jgi:hypothetical protein